MDGRTDTIETTSGPVRGEHRRGAQRWKGLPFAASPVGELRFAPPQPTEPWTEVFDAVGRFPIVPQPQAGMDAMAGNQSRAQESEEGCLTLNVWSPSPAGRRPVLFWIHGGGFATGAGSIPWYDGTNLALRDAVVVTCNYRLGPLGFLHLADVDPSCAGSGNVGLLDQVAALEWVRDNIAAFGGDPDNVTIFGESAGGMSVGTLLGTPAAAGLFHKAIAQSGAASNVSTAARASEVAQQVMSLVGAESVAELRRVPADELVRASTKVAVGTLGDAGLPFQPVVDGDVLPAQPRDAITAGSSTGIPLLTGSNAHEWRLFSLTDPSTNGADRDAIVRGLDKVTGGRGAEAYDRYAAELGLDEPKRVLEAALTDVVFRLPAIDMLERHAAHTPDAFAYEFRFESRALGGELGSAHAIEIPFALDNLDAPGASFFTGEVDDEMRALATAMADAWVAFARDGVPSAADLPEWPRYDVERRPVMVLDLDRSVEDDPGGALRNWWADRS